MPGGRLVIGCRLAPVLEERHQVEKGARLAGQRGEEPGDAGKRQLGLFQIPLGDEADHRRLLERASV
jgi:hypothetical protein